MAQESTNTFSGGLNKDLNSIATKNTLLTDSKNMTFITFNGNEMSMQNDMGNTKLIYQQTDDDGNKTGDVVDVALSEGFVPVGMKEHGGILYIASYNKAESKGEIGTFPSPEYNTESILKVLDSNFDLYIDKIIPIFNKEDYIEAGDCLIDYCFLGLNLDLITLSQDDRKIYTYKILNTLNGNDITKYCSNLKLDNGTAIIPLSKLYNEKNKKIYIGYNNGVSDIILAAFDGTNVKYGHGNQSILTNKIYTYSNTNVQFWMYNNKGEYVLYIHNYDGYDVFYKTKEEKRTIEYNKSTTFNFPNIQKSSLGIMFQYEDIESFKLVDREDETSIGLRKGFLKNYCCLLFDSLLTENHTKITVDKAKFHYIFYDEHYNNLFEQKYEIPINNQRLVKTNKATRLDRCPNTKNIQKEPYNKFYVYFEFEPINNDNIDLSKHTIKMTVDMSKSNLSDVGYPVKEYSNIDISLNNILVPYSSTETTTFESLYKNAINTKDYSLLFKTKLFNESITDTSCLVGNQLKDTCFKCIQEPNKTKYDDANPQFLSALILSDTNPVPSYGTIIPDCTYFETNNTGFYLYDKLYYNYGTTINKLEGIDQSYNYQWVIKFVNSQLNFSTIIGDKLSNLFYYKISCKAFDNLNKLDLYIYKTSDFNKITVNSIPKSFDIIDYLNNNDNKNEYIFELSNYKRSDRDAKVTLLNGNLNSDIEYQKVIPQGTFNRYLSVYSTEEDYLTDVNGNIGLFCLKDNGIIVDYNYAKKNNINLSTYKIGLTTYINSIRIEQDKLNYSIENVFEKDLTQFSNGEIYPVDHNNKTLLTNEIYELYNCVSPSRVYYTGSIIKKDGAPEIETNKYSIKGRNEILNVYYNNPYLFKNNSGLYSRYQMVKKDSKYYINVEFDINDFKDYKYVMFLAYTTQNTIINSNYQMVIQDSVNQDQLFNAGNSVTINKEKGLKYNRIAILFEVDKTKNIQLEISCDKEEESSNNPFNQFLKSENIPLLINPILYTVDDLIEEDDVIKCQYFRAQAARLTSYSIKDSIYSDVEFPNGFFTKPVVGKTSNVLDNYAPLPFYEF